MSGIFNSEIFNNEIFNVGAGDEAVEIVRPPLADFVFVSPYYLRQVQVYRQVLSRKKRDQNFRTMTQLYELYRAAL